MVEELNQQISAKNAELEVERNARSAEGDRVLVLEGELCGVKLERDVREKEKEEAQQMVEELNQQISAKNVELEVERNARSAEGERVLALEAKVVSLQYELDSYASVLKHVQKSRDDHAQSRYGLAQQINELKSELKLMNDELQIESNRAADALAQSKSFESKLTHMKEECNERLREKDEVCEEAQLTLLQLYQVQEELEKVFLADSAKYNQLEGLKQQLSTRTSELEAELKERDVQVNRLKVLEAELVAARSECDARDQEKDKIQEEAELILSKLHQVQDELEYYFLMCRDQKNLLACHEKNQKRAEKLLGKFYS